MPPAGRRERGIRSCRTGSCAHAQEPALLTCQEHVQACDGCHKSGDEHELPPSASILRLQRARLALVLAHLPDLHSRLAEVHDLQRYTLQEILLLRSILPTLSATYLLLRRRDRSTDPKRRLAPCAALEGGS